MSLALAIPGARSLLPPSLVAKTMQHVMRLAGDAGRLGTISTSVFNLVHGVTFMMSVTKSVHLVGVMSLAAGMVVLGAGWSGFGGQTPPPGETSEKVTGQEVLPETKPIPQEKISERRANLHSQVDQLEADLIVEQIELEDARKAYEQFMAFKRTANPESREHLVEAKLVTLESEKSKLMEQRSQLVRKVRVPSDPSLERLTNRIHEVDTAIASAEDQAKKNLIESSKNKQFELRHILTEMSISLAEKKRHLAELQTNLADLPAVKSVVQGPKRTQIGDYLIIDVLEALPGRPIQGSRLVRSDGTISLGFYGDLEVVGKTRREIKVDLIGHLQKYLNDAVLGLIEMDADSGKLQDVEPANSDRVVVDDEFEPPKTHESDAKKLDRVLKEISDLQLIQLRKMNSTPQGGKKSDPPDEE